ncbi:MAG: RluA family pseudouridine synthase [Candidatus Saccharimonadia bacterium]
MINNTFVISPELEAKRLDIVLSQKLGQSRSFWQHEIRLQNVLVNNVAVKPSHIVENGAFVQIKTSQNPTPKLVPPKLTILFEDDDIVAVDKPSGMLVHNISGRPVEPTVADFARQISSDPDINRPGIVHRLDRDTSGVLLIAKNNQSKVWLQQQFQDHTIQKTYLLAVSGHLKIAEAVIDLPIGREDNSLKHNVSPSGKTAQTSYRVVGEYNKASLIEANPKTGRTHQLRVHFAQLGHPILGDPIYRGAKFKNLSRLFLHAYEINFSDMKNNHVTVTSPLPPELKVFLDYLETAV